MADETQTIVCVPSTSWHTKDSTLIDADCGHKVWISAGAREVLVREPEDTLIKCLGCVEVTDEDTVQIAPWAQDVAEALNLTTEDVRSRMTNGMPGNGHDATGREA